MKNLQNEPKSGASQWAEEVLASLDGMERATANPFLFTRVMSKIEEKTGLWEKAASLLSKPAFAFAAVLVFVSINASVLWWSQQEEEKAALANTVTTEQMLASEFSNTQTYTLVDVNEEK